MITWFKVDDKFYSHRKVRQLTREAIALWVLAGAYCADHLTDGEISPSDVHWLGGNARDAADLVEAGLWDITEHGWAFHDWEHYQPTKDAREAERAAWRERQQRRRENQKNGTSIYPVPSRPGHMRDSRRDIPVTSSEISDPTTIADALAQMRSSLSKGTA